jgi:uncharacterized caspase-like protein
MASNLAIVIGINQYRFLQPLKYAKRDAEVMYSFLSEEAIFDHVFLFTDGSPDIGGKPTEPFRANLLRVLRQIFTESSMQDGDNCWFFFSGHGNSHNGQDYLMPIDGDPEDIENTGISTNTITNYLRSCGADNAVMILDACRREGKKSGEGVGRQTKAEARRTGVITLFSCSPNQFSYELEAIGQGAFTYALLEGLSIRGKCSTAERLNQYLEHRVPELVSQYLDRAIQIPYTIAEPLNRSHLILMPQYASLVDIATLKNDAYRAQTTQELELAQQLWIRVNAAASGQDIEAIEALQNLGILRNTKLISSQLESPQAPKRTKAFMKLSLGSVSESRPFTSDNLNKPPKSRILTRRQFLKWGIPTGIGVIGVSIASRFLGRSPQSSSVSPRSSDVPPPGLIRPEQIPRLERPQSRINIDYAELEKLLKAKKWRDADRITSNLVLLAAGSESEDFGLDTRSLSSFPCEVLHKIDSLWVLNSDGRFGFSVQFKIYMGCTNQAGGNSESTWYCFGDKVGWRVESKWKRYSDLTFSDLAPEGHLPILPSTEVNHNNFTDFRNQTPNFDLWEFLKKSLDCKLKASFKLMG